MSVISLSLLLLNIKYKYISIICVHVYGRGQVLFDDEMGFDEAAICIWSLACIRAMIAV